MTRTYLPYLCQHLHESVESLAWVGSVPRGPEQPPVLSYRLLGALAVRCSVPAQGAAKGRRGAALQRLSCNWSRDPAALLQTLASA